MPYAAPYNTWPTPQDLWDHFAGAGMMASVPQGRLATLPWQAYIDAAVARFEEVCQWKPFAPSALGTEVELTTDDVLSRLTDPFGSPARSLALPFPVISLSQLEIRPAGWGGQDTAGSEIVLQRGRDYSLQPSHAPLRKEPFTSLVFHGQGSWMNPVSPGRSGVVVFTGQFGYAAAIRADVWMAVLHVAIARATPFVESAVELQAGTGVAIADPGATSPLKKVEVKSGDVIEKFASMAGGGPAGAHQLGKAGSFVDQAEGALYTLALSLRPAAIA